jgi:hypothetical protein
MTDDDDDDDDDDDGDDDGEEGKGWRNANVERAENPFIGNKWNVIGSSG